MEMNQEGTSIHQILLKLLDGTHRFLNFTTPIITTQTLKQQIQTLSSVPSNHQLLLLNRTHLHDDRQTLNLSPAPSGPRPETTQNSQFPLVVHLLLRLRGGKGGFGSLLRGAATKAGQKKTNNFDACRDMSGRRLRHVNAEKKLEEWRAEADERKLEKMAQEFIKKKAKELVKKGKDKGGVDTDKYVQKYREDSAKCMEEVERSVRESLKGLVSSLKKRKGASEGNESDAKRFKIWFGKRKLADSDSEDSEDDSDDNEDEENNKSVVIDNGDHSDSSKEAEGSSGSGTEVRRDVVSSDTGPSDSGSEEERDSAVEESGSGESGVVLGEAATGTELELGISEEKTFNGGDKFSLQTSVVGTGAVQAEKEASDKSCFSDVGGRVSQASSVSISGEDEALVAGVSSDSISNVAVQDEVATASVEALNLGKPLNFEEISSAAELEVIGMERLKSELQARGLKCGGTLQERAARLFLLKTMPVEMLPKKLLAKK